MNGLTRVGVGMSKHNSFIILGAVSRWFAACMLCLATLCFPGCKPSVMLSSDDELREAGARIVWVRQVGGEMGSDPFCKGEQLVLMGLDMKDGTGERRLLPQVGSYRKPLFTPDGTGVVFTRYRDNAFYHVNWDGSALRKIGDGHASEVWRDPEGHVWVYYMEGELVTDAFQGKPVMRCRLDDPGIKEQVWDKTLVSTDNFQLSKDGTKAAGLYPWNQAGMVDIPARSLHLLGKGCWTSMSPDNRYLMWMFDGSHKNLLLRSLDGSFKRKIRINTTPELEQYEVYHPRWSNHPGFFAMTGPYRQQGEYNAITGGGEKINLYVGKFAADYEKVERWYRITNTPEADFFPDLWLGSMLASENDEDTEIVSGEGQAGFQNDDLWPESREALVYVWRNGKTLNAIEIEGNYYTFNAIRKGRAKYGRFHEMNVASGFFSGKDSDQLLTAAVQQSHAFTLMLNVRPSSMQSSKEGIILVKGEVALIQKEATLYFQYAEGGCIDLIEIAPEQNHFIAVTYTPREGIGFYHQGKRIPLPDDEQPDSIKFHAFSNIPLTFGGMPSGAMDWAGGIDYIAWYSRSLSSDEIERAYDAYASRQPLAREEAIPRFVVDARLLEMSSMPTPQGIAPYRSALVEYLYKVVNVIDGQLDEHDQIIVQHWAILDAVAYPLDRTAGETYRLTLESLDDHPELEGERISSELIEPVDSYLDVGME